MIDESNSIRISKERMEKVTLYRLIELLEYYDPAHIKGNGDGTISIVFD